MDNNNDQTPDNTDKAPWEMSAGSSSSENTVGGPDYFKGHQGSNAKAIFQNSSEMSNGDKEQNPGITITPYASMDTF
jgi:hypothetical protein